MPELPQSRLIKGRAMRDGVGTLPGQSDWLVRVFRRYVRQYVPRHFRAVRLSRAGDRPELPHGSATIVLNHPSWWDPLICLVLTDLFPERRHYAPMDSAALAHYGFFRRLGFFGVERDRMRGARNFLRTCRAIIERDDSMLWVTAQGRFADARERPVRLAPGVGHLLASTSRGSVVPLALELVFWDHRLPEALAYFGEPIAVRAGVAASAWTALLEQALQEGQAALAADVQRRDPGAFRVLIGADEAGGLPAAAWWRRLRLPWSGWSSGSLPAEANRNRP
jgi:1-acyl-sn-glycerol-3-phosphate acyltransferase